MRNFLQINLLVTLLCLGALFLRADEAPAPYTPALSKRPLLLSQTTDFLDNAFFFQEEGDFYTPEMVRARLKKAYDHGFRKIYFRGTGGVSYYPSKVRGFYRGGHYNFARGVNRLVKTITTYDTVAEFVKVCHELGMEIYYWEPIFDNVLTIRNYPGTPEYETTGEWPFCDPAIPEEFYMEHRKAYLPPQEFAQPVTAIRLRVYGKLAGLPPEALRLYTAPHGKPFKPYDKPYKVAFAEAAPYTLITVSGLQLTDPVVKFALEGARVSTDMRDNDAAVAYHADGARSPLNACLEVAAGGSENARIHVLGGISRGEGTDTWGTKDGLDTTLIARFGDIQRHAYGLPEFAYREPRERLKAIVGELYERYPTLDGVSFSIRCHSQVPSGSYENLGYGKHFFGFSQPVVDEYKRLYGTDPRTQPYDEHKFLKLRGQYLTETLGEIAGIVHAHGGKLQMMAPVRTSTFEGTLPKGLWRYALGATYPWWQYCGIDDFFDITTWAQRGYVDSVIMLGTGHKQTEWSARWDEEIARFRKHLEGTDVKLALHYEVCDRQEIGEVQEKFLPLLLRADIDELEFYEEHSMYKFDRSLHIYDAFRQILEASPRAVVTDGPPAR